MNKQEFILDTLLPYKEDPSTCGFDKEKNKCCYKTEDGKRCAVGKHLRDDEDYLTYGYGAESLFSEFGLKGVLTDEAYNMGLDFSTWARMQTYHDNLANLQIRTRGADRRYAKNEMNRAISMIENVEKVDLPELKINN